MSPRARGRPATDLGVVLGAIARTAAQLCEARDALIFLVDGDHHRLAARYGTVTQPEPLGARRLIRRDTPLGRTLLDRKPVHVRDLGMEIHGRFKGVGDLYRVVRVRTLLAMPLQRDGSAIGGIVIRRTRVQPFTTKQIALLKTFADQAAIAIENARLSEEVSARNRELTEALEQQTATSEILRAMSNSPTDLQPVFDIIARNASQLCGGLFSCVSRFDGELIHIMATYNYSPAALEVSRRRFPAPLGRHTFAGRTILERNVVHVQDILADHEARPDEMLATGFRSVLSVPMLHGGRPVGAITVWRAAVGSFGDGQIELLRTFADQAVIAIENVRLFSELQERNRALTEALEQQTATSEILRVISRSPTAVQPVFDAIVGNAVRLCGAVYGIVWRYDGETIHVGAVHNLPEAEETDLRNRYPRSFSEGDEVHKMMRSGRVIDVPDVDQATDIPPMLLANWRRRNVRSAVILPMQGEHEAVGAIGVSHREPGAFSPGRVELLKTFADQAIIAIENVRLFTELQARNQALAEALGQQTATAEILKVISSSPTDVQPVFDAIAESSVRLCRALFGIVLRFDGTNLHIVAHHNFTAEALVAYARVFPSPPSRTTAAGRAVLDASVVQLTDIEASPPSAIRQAAQTLGIRCVLSVPLLRDDAPLGVIAVFRREPVAFSEQQIALLKTFADQAVIAIENVRLFNALQSRTQELTRSVSQLTALGEVGQAVSSTLDLETVLTTIASRASQLAATDTCTVYEYDEQAEQFHLRATHNVDERVLELTRVRPVRKGEGVAGRVAETRAPVQVEDVAQEGAYFGPLRETLLAGGVRSVLAIPLLREDHLIGVLIVSRKMTGRFADEVIALLQTFATQSAIAIQNARLFRELEAKSRELEVASRHKSQFLANMSHELRTPMNAILGYTELIADGIYGGVPERMRDVLTRVEASGRHLLGLINDVLDLSKIEAGQLTLMLADYSMKEVVEAVVAAVESLAAEKRLRLVVDLAPDLPTGRGDQRRLAQVLLNLVGNAIKFTEQGQIAIRVGAAADLFTVAVSDSGPGIAPADQERIFEEFQQADTSTTRPKGGTGLGLAIARRIVTMHGGRIWVESILGEGATFRFTIPVRVEQQAVQRSAAAS